MIISQYYDKYLCAKINIAFLADTLGIFIFIGELMMKWIVLILQRVVFQRKMQALKEHSSIK